MDDRKSTSRALALIEQEMKELEIAYEQYFAGVEKREPVKARENLSKILRQISNRRIIQTDLRFRYQNLATRFHSYTGYWDRILRLIDEGRYSRQHGALPKLGIEKPPEWTPLPPLEPQAAAKDDIDRIIEQLATANRICGVQTPVPDRRQMELFLEKQREKIREKFGDREVSFSVETENGKPKIKVKAKN